MNTYVTRGLSFSFYIQVDKWFPLSRDNFDRLFRRSKLTPSNVEAFCVIQSTVNNHSLVWDNEVSSSLHLISPLYISVDIYAAKHFILTLSYLALCKYLFALNCKGSSLPFRISLQARCLRRWFVEQKNEKAFISNVNHRQD